MLTSKNNDNKSNQSKKKPSSPEANTTSLNKTSSSSKTGKKKILVFAHHLKVLDGIEDCLRETRTNYVRIDGSCSSSARSAAIKKFQNDDEV